MFDEDTFVALAQESEEGVDHRRASPGQIAEAPRVLVEEAGQGLRTPLADLVVGAEGKPGLGHALEAAERHVGHPRQDLDEWPLGDAPQWLLLLLVLLLLLLTRLQMGETAQFSFPSLHPRSKKKKEQRAEQTSHDISVVGDSGGERD
jgi:hypothetical protein